MIFHHGLAVSLVEEDCETPTNYLSIIYNLPAGEKGKFAVCVKGMDFPLDDLSVRMVEWLEVLKALGADKIFLYNLDVHPNVRKVLSDYSSRGEIEVIPISLPDHQPNLPWLQHLFIKSKLIHKRQNEIVPYNDCLYRNMYRYEYITLLDTDEVIVPTNHSNWSDLMKDLVRTTGNKTSWAFRNVYFFDDFLEKNEGGHIPDIPPYLHMMQHVYRSDRHTPPGHYIKAFHDPQKVLTLHNHFPFSCLGGCRHHSVDTSLGQLQHYRPSCVSEIKRKICEERYRRDSVRDTSLWSVRDTVVQRANNVLQTLGFIHE